MKIPALYSSQNPCFLCFPFERSHQFLSASRVSAVAQRNCLQHTCCSYLAIYYNSKSTFTIQYNCNLIVPSLQSSEVHIESRQSLESIQVELKRRVLSLVWKSLGEGIADMRGITNGGTDDRKWPLAIDKMHARNNILSSRCWAERGTAYNTA